MHTERFAPSPTGPLHIGHAYSAWLGWHRARAASGRFLLRLEDLDQGRVRPEWDALILEDLAWLGLDWDGPVIKQSARLPAYRTALERLEEQGLVYGCDCTRRDIAEAMRAPQEGIGPIIGLDGPIYPGTCRARKLSPGPDVARRLDMARAITWLGGSEAVNRLWFEETGYRVDGVGRHVTLDAAELATGAGDIVLARKDGTAAYHLVVVVDDAWQMVSHVTRGEDLFAATAVQRMLQALLGLPSPVYYHHALVRDAAGKRLAKRDDARAIASYRESGLSPAEVLILAGVSDPDLA